MRAGLASALVLFFSHPVAAGPPPTTQADSARAAVERAAKAMGGREALVAIRTVEREMRTETSDPTQGGRPSRPGELDPPFYLTGAAPSSRTTPGAASVSPRMAPSTATSRRASWPSWDPIRSAWRISPSGRNRCFPPGLSRSDSSRSRR
jgi:hypothetical protein